MDAKYYSKLESILKYQLRKRTSSHQRAIERLSRRIYKKYRGDLKLLVNYEFENGFDKESGESDLIALIGFYEGKRRYALIFEVKGSRTKRSKVKVTQQLEKAKREIRAFYGEDIKCFCFSVYTSNNYFRNKKWNSKPYKISWRRDIK